MKKIRAVIKTFFFTLLALDAAVFVMVYIMGEGVAESYKINKGETLQLETGVPVKAVFDADTVGGYNVGDTFSVDLKMFGVIPFSKVDVEVVDEMYAVALGTPFGMKLYTEGVLVVNTTDVETAAGLLNPAREAGIKIGDYIKSANGVQITCNEDLSELVVGSNGAAVRLETVRDGQIIVRNVTPVQSADGSGYRIGIWVRDSSAGIGTLTFYSPSTGVVCGLGHGICDSDTGSLLKVDSGELVGAQIVSVDKGSNGDPGELKGRFTAEKICNISLNSEGGVYGLLTGKVDASNVIEIALKQEVRDGEAQILCTVDGDKPALYSCTVEKRMSAYHSDTQNLTVTITDPKLIETTGGIVQGLSGSPIIQNGKLIGAVTHVLVDDCKTGYGIFAENMLETAQGVAEKQLKEAS